MFRASSAQLQEDTVVYMQHMSWDTHQQSSPSSQFSLKLCTDRPSRTLIETDYHMLHVYNFILRKMSPWGSKHVEENNILWINNNQCIKLVINI